MPELPEVETVKEALRQHVVGFTIADVDILVPKMIKTHDADVFRHQLINQTIRDVTRRGKHLIFHLDDFRMISHLRMEGKYFFRDELDKPTKHVHLNFKFTNGKSLWYDDVRKFGTFHLYPKEIDLETTSQFKILGPEPFDDAVTVEYLSEKLQHKQKPIKSLLLDQTVFTGLGNIYVDEVLFRCKIHPLVISSKLTKKERADVIKYSQEVLRRAIELKGTTIKTFASEHGGAGAYQNELKVHTRKGEPCPACGTVIEKIKVGGRGTYFCSKCQPLRKNRLNG